MLKIKKVSGSLNKFLTALHTGKITHYEGKSPSFTSALQSNLIEQDESICVENYKFWRLTFEGQEALREGVYRFKADPNNKRGGARVGTGPKTEKTSKLQQVTLALDDRAIGVFLALGKGNLSLGARRAAGKAK